MIRPVATLDGIAETSQRTRGGLRENPEVYEISVACIPDRAQSKKERGIHAPLRSKAMHRQAMPDAGLVPALL